MWNVFRSPALDYRLVMVGSVIPLVDVVFGGPAFLHTLLFAVVLLGAIMVTTSHRRLLRRRLISLPIGVLTGLVLDGAWATKSVFWWPGFGVGFPGGGLPELQRGMGWLLLLDIIGIASLAWCWVAFGWSDKKRRELFWRTGHLDRELLR
ncbi:MAG: hypothetical protein WCK41_02945 [Actinomycetes bacterium]